MRSIDYILWKKAIISFMRSNHWVIYLERKNISPSSSFLGKNINIFTGTSKLHFDEENPFLQYGLTRQYFPQKNNQSFCIKQPIMFSSGESLSFGSFMQYSRPTAHTPALPKKQHNLIAKQPVTFSEKENSNISFHSEHLKNEQSSTSFTGGIISP